MLSESYLISIQKAIEMKSDCNLKAIKFDIGIAIRGHFNHGQCLCMARVMCVLPLGGLGGRPSVNRWLCSFRFDDVACTTPARSPSALRAPEASPAPSARLIRCHHRINTPASEENSRVIDIRRKTGRIEQFATRLPPKHSMRSMPTPIGMRSRLPR